MNGFIVSGVIVVLALLISCIAVWVGVYMAKGSNKPALRQPARPSAVARAEAPVDLWGVERLRRGQRALS